MIELGASSYLIIGIARPELERLNDRLHLSARFRPNDLLPSMAVANVTSAVPLNGLCRYMRNLHWMMSTKDRVLLFLIHNEAPMRSTEIHWLTQGENVPKGPSESKPRRTRL